MDKSVSARFAHLDVHSSIVSALSSCTGTATEQQISSLATDSWLDWGLGSEIERYHCFEYSTFLSNFGFMFEVVVLLENKSSPAIFLQAVTDFPLICLSSIIGWSIYDEQKVQLGGPSYPWCLSLSLSCFLANTPQTVQMWASYSTLTDFFHRYLFFQYSLWGIFSLCGIHQQIGTFQKPIHKLIWNYTQVIFTQLCAFTNIGCTTDGWFCHKGCVNLFVFNLGS